MEKSLLEVMMPRRYIIGKQYKREIEFELLMGIYMGWSCPSSWPGTYIQNPGLAIGLISRLLDRTMSIGQERTSCASFCFQVCMKCLFSIMIQFQQCRRLSSIVHTCLKVRILVPQRVVSIHSLGCLPFLDFIWLQPLCNLRHSVSVSCLVS